MKTIAHISVFLVVALWIVCLFAVLPASDAATPKYTQGTPSVTRVTDSSCHINVRLDTQGWFYYIIIPAGSPTPTRFQVKAGRDAEDQDVDITGDRQVTTITLTFTEIVFPKLNQTTSYDVYIVAQDSKDPPNLGLPQLVPFTTLDGRRWFGVGRGGRENNRLGLGDVRDHWTPHAVPAWGNVTVGDVQFAELTFPWGQVLRFGDIWNARFEWSTQNQEYVPNKKKAYLSAGGNHWLGVLAKNGVTFALSFGKNDHGRLGLNDDVVHLTATAINEATFQQVTKAQAGLDFSTVINDNKLYTFGHNNLGQLGLGDVVDRWTPSLIEGFTNVKLVSAGRDHVLFVDSGQVYSFGSNRFGQLGVGDTTDRLTPTAIPGFNDVNMVVAGNYFSLLVQDRQVYSFGYNFQTGGRFEGYSPHNIKCYEQHSAGCYDVGKPSPNLDDPDNPFNP